MKKLTDKQTRFILEFLTDLNATQAAIRAGYSAKTAYSIGSENLMKPEIQEAIAAAQAALADEAKITQRTVRQMFVDAYSVAKEEKAASAMNGSASGLAKLLGLNEPDKLVTEQFEERPMEINISVLPAENEIKITHGREQQPG